MTHSKEVGATEVTFESLHRDQLALLKAIYEERVAIRDRRIADLEAVIETIRVPDGSGATEVANSPHRCRFDSVPTLAHTVRVQW